MEREDRLENKIDKIIDKIGSIDTTLSAQHESLKIHIKRTDLLEKKVDAQEAYINKVTGALKLISSAGVIMTLIKVFTDRA